MALLPMEATVEVIRTTVEVVDKPKTEAGMKKLLCVPILCMALLWALGPAHPGSCGREQATGSVLLVDLWGRGGGP